MTRCCRCRLRATIRTALAQTDVTDGAIDELDPASGGVAKGYRIACLDLVVNASTQIAAE